MAADDDIEEAVTSLAALPTAVRVEVLRRLFAATEAEDRPGLRDRWYIGLVQTYKGPEVTKPTREIAAVAYPDRAYDDGGYGPEPELWESGSCPTCGTEVVSTAKRASCPICGSITFLT